MQITLHAVNGQIVFSGAKVASFGSVERKLGPWGHWKWDGSTLRAAVDRYGFYPLFYAALPDGVAVSDSIAKLLSLGASPAFDDGAIAAFLRLGFFLGDDTPFSAIRAFPVGGRLTWSAGSGLKVEAELIQRAPDASLSRAEAVAGYVEYFRSAVGRSMPLDPRYTALPLSGGRDSRHIALELKRIGFQPGLVISQRHFSSHSDDDADVASKLCRALGWPITVALQFADPVASEIEKNRRFDCLSDEHGWFVPAARQIEAAGARVVFDGIAGDALSKGLFVRKPWMELGRLGKFSEVFNSLPVSGYGAPESALAKLLSPEYLRRWSRELGLSRMMTEVSKYLYDDNPLNQFFFWNRTRREIAPFLVRYLPGMEVITPYLDPDVFDFLWNLPTAFMEDHRFHDEAIAMAAPEYARIPFEAGKQVADPDAHTALLMRGMARLPSFWWGGDILNRQWLRPRLARAIVSRRFARGTEWLAPNWAIWLASLENLADSRQ